MQLLALMIEVISIQVAGKQIKKPIDIPRPGKKGKGGKDGQGRRHPDDTGPQQQGEPAPQQRVGPTGPATSRDAAFKQGIAVLQASTKSRS